MQSINYFGWSIFLVFLAVLLYLFYRWRISLSKEEESKEENQERNTEERSESKKKDSEKNKKQSKEENKEKKFFKKKLFKFPNIFSKTPRMQKKLNALKTKIKFKRKEKEHQDIFLKFALTPLKLTAKPFDKLEKIVKRQNPQTPLQKLEELHQEKLEKEKRIKEKIARKKEHLQTILKLRKIVEKK